MSSHRESGLVISAVESTPERDHKPASVSATVIWILLQSISVIIPPVEE